MKKNYVNLILNLNANENNVEFIIFDDKQVVQSEKFEFEREMLVKGDYDKIFLQVIERFISQKFDYEFKSCHVILPDYLCGIDYVNVPKISKNQMIEALKTEVNKLYNVKMLEIKSQLVNMTKTNYTFQVSFLNKDVKEKIMFACHSKKIFIKAFSFESVCIFNGTLSLLPKIKKTNGLVVSVSDNSLHIILHEVGQIHSFVTLPISKKKNEKFLFNQILLSLEQYENLTQKKPETLIFQTDDEKIDIYNKLKEQKQIEVYLLKINANKLKANGVNLKNNSNLIY